jgi:hypothetical protein
MPFDGGCAEEQDGKNGWLVGAGGPLFFRHGEN